ncbi:MAG TPA: YHS domain-containing protein [Candidatus Limnocylindria bacterium]
MTEAPAARTCPICGVPLEEPPALRLRYEGRVYAFDRETCKRIFQENPDRYLDAGGGVLPEPR